MKVFGCDIFGQEESERNNMSKYNIIVSCEIIPIRTYSYFPIISGSVSGRSGWIDPGKV